MIFYFSGTGNSKYIAERISNALNEPLFSINDAIKNNEKTSIESGERVILVTPTYAWRIPRVVKSWLLKSDFLGAKKIYFVMSCGGEIGNAEKFNIKYAGEKNLRYMGTAQILMPENYIAMFGAPQKDEAKNIVESAENDILKTIDLISKSDFLSPPKSSVSDKFRTELVNGIFYAVCVKAKDFKVDSKCVGCAKCVKVCPLNNIKLVDKKPVWDNNCTHCMACITSCPTESIEYGKKSIGQPRYRFEKL